MRIERLEYLIRDDVIYNINIYIYINIIGELIINYTYNLLLLYDKVFNIMINFCYYIT
jgi:hypothetical protein